MAKGQKLEIQLPDTPETGPSVHPDIADLRERLSAAETTLASRSTESPVATEAMRLAAEAHQLAAQAIAKADRQTEAVAIQAEPSRVLAVDLPRPEAPLENTAELATTPPAFLGPRRPWWHPSRLL